MKEIHQLNENSDTYIKGISTILNYYVNICNSDPKLNLPSYESIIQSYVTLLYKCLYDYGIQYINIESLWIIIIHGPKNNKYCIV